MGNNVGSTREFYTVHGTSQAMPFLLKPSGTTVLLSDMATNGSSSPDASVRCAHFSSRRFLQPQHLTCDLKSLYGCLWRPDSCFLDLLGSIVLCLAERTPLWKLGGPEVPGQC